MSDMHNSFIAIFNLKIKDVYNKNYIDNSGKHIKICVLLTLHGSKPVHSMGGVVTIVYMYIY